MKAPLKVLLVPDHFSWVLGTWAKQIVAHRKEHSYLFFSTNMAHFYPEEFDSLVQMVDVVHVLTQHGFLHLSLPPDKAVIGTILHVVDWTELQPVAQSDLVCYMSSEWGEYLHGQGVPKARLSGIRYGIDAGFFCPSNSQEARGQLRINSHEFLIGFFGKYSSDHAGRKGADILVRTLDLLAQRGRHVGALITGPGWLPLVRALQATGLSVYYFPFLHSHEMPMAYNALDAYLIASRIEGGPVPLLEAMACGIPVIATPVGMVPEVIVDGANGILIPKDSPCAAADALFELMDNRELAGRIAQNGRQTILRDWQWDNVLQRIDSLYERALQNRNHRLTSKRVEPGTSVSNRRALGRRIGSLGVTSTGLARQRRAVLAEDSMLWHNTLFAQGHHHAALRLSLNLWRANIRNLKAGQRFLQLVGREVRRRIKPVWRDGNVASPIAARDTELKDRTVAWIFRMRDERPAEFDFRISPSNSTPTLLSQCFAILGLEILDALSTISSRDRKHWVAQISQCQRDSGSFLDPSLDSGDLPARGHNWEYLTWQSTFFALAALDALGETVHHPLPFLESFKSPLHIRSWLEQRDWRDPWLESNNVMFITSFLIRKQERTGETRTAETLDALFNWLDEHQNPVTGYWDLGQGASLRNAMAGAFHLYFLYFYTGRAVRHPERILESTLALQQPDGLFDPRGGGGACLDLDAIDILVKFSLVTDYRAEDIKVALTRAFNAILKNQNPDGGFCEAKRPPQRKSLKRRAAELLGLDRLLNRPWQGWPVEHLSYSGWDRMRYRVDESDLWSTWFRPLALALISTRYPGEFVGDVNWRFRRTPTLGWHNVDRMKAIRARCCQ